MTRAAIRGLEAPDPVLEGALTARLDEVEASGRPDGSIDGYMEIIRRKTA